MRSAEDATARARIRDAAVDRFGRDGFAAATVRAVAADAGVSAALVLHHFGSKAGLREACDEHVLALIRQAKTEALTAKTPAEGVAYLAYFEKNRPLLVYLSRALADGSPAGGRVFDALVDDAQSVLEAGVAAGRIRECADPRARALVLTAYGLAPLLLASHLARHLGGDGYDDVQRAIAPASLELFTHGLFPDDSLLQAMQASLAT